MPRISRASLLRGALASAFLTACGSRRPGTDSPALSVARPAPAPDRAAPAGDVLRVGVLCSTSGPLLGIGADVARGLELSARYANEGRAPGARAIELRVQDDASTREGAVESMRRLAADPRVLAVVAGTPSSLTVAAAVVANERGVPLVASCATSPEVTAVGPFIFSNVVSDDVMGRRAAELAVAERKARTGILSTAMPYSQALARSFRERTRELGGAPPMELTSQTDGSDLEAALRGVASARLDLVFAPITYDLVLAMAPRLATHGIASSSLLGGDGWDADELLGSPAIAALAGARFINHWAPGAPAERTKTFESAAAAERSGSPSALVALAFEAGLLVTDALLRVDEPTRDRVRSVLAATTSFEGLLGPMSLDATRRPIRAVVVVTVGRPDDVRVLGPS